MNVQNLIRGAAPTRVPNLPTVIIGLVCSLLLHSAAHADALAEDQWHTMRSSLAEGARHGNYWQYGWGAFHAGVLGVSAYQASEASDREDRYDARVSAVTSALGLIDIIINPMPHRRSHRAVERLYADDPTDPDGLKEARQHFRRAAQAEVDRRAWRYSLNSFLVNLAAGLVIGIGDDRPEDGAIQFASGMLITGLKVWSMPNQASQGWHEDKPLRVSVSDVPITLDYAFHFSPTKVGFELRF